MENPVEPEKRGWRRLLYLTVASLFFALGFLGAILPGLPATPFLLLTSYFLVRSSPKLNERLLKSRLLGPILTDWQVHGGVRRDVKVQAIVFVVLAVAVSIYLANASTVVSATVVGLALIGIYVIIRLPAAK